MNNKTNPISRTPTMTEFLAMDEGQIIEFCCRKEGGWSQVPKELISEAVISAVILAHPRGINIIRSVDSPLRQQHVESALLHWKSKAFQVIKSNDCPQNEAFICELIEADPALYRHLPRAYKTQRMADTAIAADIKMFEETPSTLISEHHVLLALDHDPLMLSSTSKSVNVSLSEATCDRLIERAPNFATRLCSQLKPEQILTLANVAPFFWSHERIGLADTLQLMAKIVQHPEPGAGAQFIKDKLIEYRGMRNRDLYAAVFSQSGMNSLLALTALNIHDPGQFAQHVKNIPKLIPIYQTIYGGQTAMALTQSSKVRRSILDQDMGL